MAVRRLRLLVICPKYQYSTMGASPRKGRVVS